MKLWTLLLLFHFTYEAVGQSDEILDVSDEIDIPPGKLLLVIPGVLYSKS